jgi:antirestriction protein ArdC
VREERNFATHKLFNLFFPIAHSFDSPDVVSHYATRPPTIAAAATTTAATSTTSSNGSSSACVADLGEVCGPANVSHGGGWSKSDDSVFIREVAHACSLWERLQLHQQQQQQQQQPQQPQKLHVKVKLVSITSGGRIKDGTNKKDEIM